jgi:hypothetical protein
LLYFRPFAPVAQLDRVPGYEPGGRGFKSCRARHYFSYQFNGLERLPLRAVSFQRGLLRGLAIPEMEDEIETAIKVMAPDWRIAGPVEYVSSSRSDP